MRPPLEKAVTAAAVAVLTLGAGAQTFNPLVRYNNIAESTFILNKCGALTPERHEWLMHTLELAARSIQGTAPQWEQYDKDLLARLEKAYPSVPKERCEALARSVDHERQTIPRAK